MSFLLDTNVISELRKPDGRRNPGVTAWAESVCPTELFLSVISISELATWVGLTQRRDAAAGEHLAQWFDRIRQTYAARTLDIDPPVAIIAGQLHVPDPRDYRDAFIAATAIEHQLTVATRNTADFIQTGVPTLNPFSA
ncbi:MAG: type II toxin-antitoxin system VapC family toxin [Bifidobacteriaceae bacterium]|jgi:predicted nucleic acid-binding protein|nr:type II toxin-antitoxin system VapC family toxin [Bifidobacteriaceae bacterium]